MKCSYGQEFENQNCAQYHCATCELQPSAASDCYARPRTRGELRNLLANGIPCEVVETLADMTAIMLKGWLKFPLFTMRPSENEGWVVFEV